MWSGSEATPRTFGPPPKAGPVYVSLSSFRSPPRTSAAARPVCGQRGNEPTHLFRHEGLLEDVPARAGQEVAGGSAQRVAGDEGGAPAQVRPVLLQPTVQGLPVYIGHAQVAQDGIVIAVG